MSILKKMISASFKSLLVFSVLFSVSAISADNTQESVQLAQLSDGFDAEAKYMASCFACHSTGAAGAPKVGPGNSAAWDERLEKGMETVVANAINGVNVMPAKGMCFDCTDDDLRAIVEYMIESSAD